MADAILLPPVSLRLLLSFGGVRVPRLMLPAWPVKARFVISGSPFALSGAEEVVS